MNLLVTGGYGFIGSNFIKEVIDKDEIKKLINLDLVTYAANKEKLEEVEKNPKYTHAKVDLNNYNDVSYYFEDNEIDYVIHFAAESHVDNSITGPRKFIESNVVGTFNLLECAREFHIKRFHHVSTDEVYGEAMGQTKFTEDSPYDPKNPYAATKAASDFLVRVYGNTFNLDYTLSNCGNNYGPRQNKEKFMPVVIRSLLDGKKIPVYGNGQNVRDWIYVQDHCQAIWKIFSAGLTHNTYLVGARNERTNVEVIGAICKALGLKPEEHIEFVKDRPGHDSRYAIDPTKIEEELEWKASTNFEQGIEKTIRWYKGNV